jgi:hypothetical protein
MGAPVTAAVLIQLTGNGGWGYVVCTVLYCLVMISTRLMRTVAMEPATGSMLRAFLNGWTFIAHERPVLTQLVIGFGPLTIGFTYQAMLVAYVKDTLGQQAAAYGALYSFAGLGALLGGLMVASLGPSARGGKMLIITGFLNGLAMMGMGSLGLLPRTWLLFWLAVPFLMLAGGSQTSFRAANNGLLLRATPGELRGRVMALDGGFRSVGTLIAPIVGLIADTTSAALAMAAIGLGSLLVVAGVLAWQPRIWESTRPSEAAARRA